ncbi:ABC transporter ATP-binding protein [Acidobacteriota bacterium]
MEGAIAARDLTKAYRRRSRRHRFLSLKSALVRGELFRTSGKGEKIQALKDVSFEVPKGATFGVVGANGSGKSTLLKIMAGILKPTSGEIEVRGRIASLIELGAGFHPEISGRENIKINAIMLGLSRREIEERFDSIVEFSGLGDFIEDPVKTYSSGMYTRLGFAVAVSVDPDVLLVDEILAVGDEAFSRKCMDKFREFKRRGKTIVIVSHDLDTINLLCEQVMWLKEGEVKGIGHPRETIDAYRSDVETGEESALRDGTGEAEEEATETAPEDEEGKVERQEARRRWGSGAVEIKDIRLLDTDGQEKRLFHTGDRMIVKLDIDAKEEVTDFVFGIGIFNGEGMCCYGTNTDVEGFKPKALSGTAKAFFDIKELNLVQGTYYIDAAVHKKDGFAYDYRHLWVEFKVRSPLRDEGVFRPDHTWRFEGGIDLKTEKPRN